jgi:(R,R)-butanediol dehydrogenase / meso-butanediol dehydrogenase / diacetyl reductase
VKATGRGVYYEGSGSFIVRAAPQVPPGAGEVRIDVAYCGICGTDIHIAHGGMDHRVRVPQVIGHEMSGRIAEIGPDVDGANVGDRVVVRPLDARGETAADKGFSHISRNLKFLGIDTPGAFQTSWTVPAFTIHQLPDAVDLRLAALTEPLAVACHDVRRAEVTADDTVVVIGGGPIGLLIALVAREEGARVMLSEINPERLGLARELGFETIDPDSEVGSAALSTLGAAGGADVVFEVSGSAAGAMAMTELASIRGRIVVVAIYPEPQPVRLFDVFWKELQLRGARVYEPEDFERAIELLAAEVLPLERLISAVEPLERLPDVLAEMAAGASGIKTLVDCTS